MGRPEKILSWWDREVDRVGRPIRDDVVPPLVKSGPKPVVAPRLLLSTARNADLMEDSVARVSRYLGRIEAPKSSPKNGLLLLASPNCCEISRHEVPEALRR
jgi:hypothetical protein